MIINLRQRPESADQAPIHLTPREHQVLLWCAYGKSSWEIGRAHV